MRQNSSTTRLIVMGVSGCGKSTLARALSERLGWRMIEGDTFHSEDSIAKMHRGEALDDEDRRAWLEKLAWIIGDASADTVITCSALKARYREQLRAAAPGHVKFVYMKLSEAESFRRVSSRKGHPFPAALVHSQFDALESPEDEPNVLTLDADRPTAEQEQSVEHWLKGA